MKVLLLNPPTLDNRAFIREGRCNQEQGVWATLWPPVTLATAGGVLEAGGHDVTILDCPAGGMRRQELLADVERKGYSFVAWSTGTPSISSDLALANEIRSINQPIKTAVFGTHVSTLTEQCLQETQGLDFIVRGEPEESLSELVDCLDQKGDLAQVEGISYRDASGRIGHNPARSFVRELDDFPFPAWHLLDLQNYTLPFTSEKFVILSPIRGCPYPCTFCTAQTYYGKALRKRSVIKIIEEIEQIINRFGVRQFFIWADTFTADRGYVLDFCQSLLDRQLKIGWVCNSRVNTIDDELLEIMARAGCWMMSFGIESGSQAVLDASQKNATLSQARDAIRMTRASGIKAVGHFVLGLPGDSEDSMRETIDFACSLPLDLAQFYSAVPAPGSALYDQARAEKWIQGQAFEAFRQDNAVMNLPGLPPSVVNDYRRRAFRRFYSRPGRILRILQLMTRSGFQGIIKGSSRFIGWTSLARISFGKS